MIGDVTIHHIQSICIAFFDKRLIISAYIKAHKKDIKFKNFMKTLKAFNSCTIESFFRHVICIICNILNINKNVV